MKAWILFKISVSTESLSTFRLLGGEGDKVDTDVWSHVVHRELHVHVVLVIFRKDISTV